MSINQFYVEKVEYFERFIATVVGDLTKGLTLDDFADVEAYGKVLANAIKRSSMDAGDIEQMLLKVNKYLDALANLRRLLGLEADLPYRVVL